MRKQTNKKTSPTKHTHIHKPTIAAVTLAITIARAHRMYGAKFLSFFVSVEVLHTLDFLGSNTSKEANCFRTLWYAIFLCERKIYDADQTWAAMKKKKIRIVRIYAFMNSFYGFFL